MKFQIKSHYNKPSEIAYVPNIQEFVDNMTKPTIDEINQEKNYILSEFDVKEFVHFFPNMTPILETETCILEKLHKMVLWISLAFYTI